MSDHPPCDEEIFKSGSAVCTFAAPSAITEPWVKKVAAESGQRVDWHYSGGRVNVLFLGSYDRVKKAVEKLMPELSAECKADSLKRYAGLEGIGPDQYPEAFMFFEPSSRGLYREGDLDR